MNNSIDQLAARLVAIECLVVQNTIVTAKQIPGLDTDQFISVLRASFDAKSAHLNEDFGAVVLESYDRLLSWVEASLKAPPSAPG